MNIDDFDETQLPEEEEILTDVIVEQAKDIMILKKLVRDMIKTLKMAGNHSGVLIAFIGKAIKLNPELQTTDEFRSIPKELKEIVDMAEMSADILAINKTSRIKSEKSGGGSDNIQ